ncbi:hypothetical protein [Xylanibacter rodentium]|nr:hypothetical protein [Xylanibacter rodentium]
MRRLPRYIVTSSATPGDIKSFFKWVSSSVSTSSMMVNKRNQE